MVSGRRAEPPPNKLSKPTIPQFVSRKCCHKILLHSFKSNSPRFGIHSNSNVLISCRTLSYLPVHFNASQVIILSSLPTGLGLHYKNWTLLKLHSLTSLLPTNSTNIWITITLLRFGYRPQPFSLLLCGLSIANGKTHSIIFKLYWNYCNTLTVLKV